jgi:hypothetical protein
LSVVAWRCLQTQSRPHSFFSGSFHFSISFNVAQSILTTATLPDGGPASLGEYDRTLDNSSTSKVRYGVHQGPHPNRDDRVVSPFWQLRNVADKMPQRNGNNSTGCDRLD